MSEVGGLLTVDVGNREVGQGGLTSTSVRLIKTPVIPPRRL